MTQKRVCGDRDSGSSNLAPFLTSRALGVEPESKAHLSVLTGEQAYTIPLQWIRDPRKGTF